MPTNNENNNTTAQERDVWFIQFPFDEAGKSHPGSILGFENELIKVCSGTSQSWHEGDDPFVKVDGDGTNGLRKATYFQTSEIYHVPLESLKFKTGTLNENAWGSITERVGRGAL